MNNQSKQQGDEKGKRKYDMRPIKGNGMTLYNIHKKWNKRGQPTLNQEEVEHRLYNNLPVDDLYDTLKFRYERENDDENM